MCRGTLLLMIWMMWAVICVSTTRLHPFLDNDAIYDSPLKNNLVFIKVRNAGIGNNLNAAREDDDFIMDTTDYEYVMPLEFQTKRRQNLYPSVEVGPGAFKTEIIEYPPDTLKNQLSNLMRLKKELEERSKP
ncbi:unnamed protein product, partial [Iphiclides podalirius]